MCQNHKVLKKAKNVEYKVSNMGRQQLQPTVKDKAVVIHEHMLETLSSLESIHTGIIRIWPRPLHIADREYRKRSHLNFPIYSHLTVTMMKDRSKLKRNAQLPKIRHRIFLTDSTCILLIVRTGGSMPSLFTIIREIDCTIKTSGQVKKRNSL